MDTAPTSTIQVAFQTIAKGPRSGVREFQQQIARNQREWKTLWQRHSATETNTPPPPVVDFNREIVVAVFLGEKPTGGFAVEIVRVGPQNGELAIDFREINPASGAMVAQGLTQPFHIVRIDGEVGTKVTFRRES